LRAHDRARPQQVIQDDFAGRLRFAHRNGRLMNLKSARRALIPGSMSRKMAVHGIERPGEMACGRWDGTDTQTT
jgi:hypothetical protein